MKDPKTRMERLKGMDVKDLSPFLHGDPNSPLLQLLHHYIIAPDNLHNMKGAIETLLKLERKQKGWNESAFLLNVNKYLQRKGIPTCIYY